MEDAVIVSAVRTPVGSFGGQFKDVAATELGAQAVRAALERAEIAGEDVDEVVLGCVLTAGLGQNPARQAAIGAGIPTQRRPDPRHPFARDAPSRLAARPRHTLRRRRSRAGRHHSQRGAPVA